jgi:hypothetical protein
MRTFLLAIPILLMTGCSAITDIDVDDLEPIPEIAQLDFSTIQPAQNTTYWELRFGYRTCQACNDPADSVIAVGGMVTRAQLDANTRAALAALRPPTGFAQGCLPSQCFLYIAAVQNGSVVTFNTVDGLKSFLGVVNTEAEAVLLLRASGFWWDPAGEDTGMKTTGTGWEFVVLETVRFCQPVQTDRVRLRITADGALREIDREVFEKSNACV